jgi:hypothetical protein
MTGAPTRQDDADVLNGGGAFAVIQQAFGAPVLASDSEPVESAYKLLSVLADRRTGREVQPRS